MNQHQLLAELFRRGVKVWADGDQLHVRAPKGALTPELRDSLAAQKLEILSAVSSMNIATRASHVPLVRVSRDGGLPLSFNQQRLLSLAQLRPESQVYNLCKALRLTGPLNVPVLAQSIREIVKRHEVLRSTFPVAVGQSAQIIASDIPVELPAVDLRELHATERQFQVERLASMESRQPFDLAQGPLLRVKLLQLGDEEHLFFVTAHHLVFDGWSVNVFYRELATLYAAFATGKPSTLPALPIQYADFAHWEQQMLQHEALNAQLDYWKQQLGGNVTALELPLDRPRPQGQTSQGARQSLALPEKLTDAIKALSQREESTLFMILLAAFQTLLHGYTGQENIVVCSPVAGRRRSETKELIGYFSRLLPMRTDFSGKPSFRDVLGRVRRVVLGAYEHQDVPLQSLADFPNLVRTPLSRGMFLLQIPSQLPAPPGLTANLVDVHNGVSDFELSLSMEETAVTLTGVFEYKTDLFDDATVSQMIRDFQTLLEEIVANPDRRIAKIERRAPPALGQMKTADNRPFTAPRNELELELTRIWEEVLAVQPIGVHDNFFELGGHSLLAVRLFTQLEALCGKKLPLATLFQATTIEQLANLLRREQWSPLWSSLVAIKPDGTKPPFYCVHGIHGNVLNFRVLASHLDPNQPFYGLQAKGLDGQETPHTRVEQMAAHYLQEIRAVQQEGPYCLGGFSSGGLIAFEMAQQLYTRGQRVALLVLFDTSMPGASLRYKLSFLVQRIAVHMRSLFLLSPQEKFTYIRRRVGRRIRLITSIIFQRRRPPLSPVLQDIAEAGYLAARTYAPQIYPGRVTVFRAGELSIRSFRDSDLGWSKLALGGVKVCQVGGVHESMLDELHVRALAEKLQVCLDEAQTYDTR